MKSVLFTVWTTRPNIKVSLSPLQIQKRAENNGIGFKERRNKNHFVKCNVAPMKELIGNTCYKEKCDALCSFLFPLLLVLSSSPVSVSRGFCLYFSLSRSVSLSSPLSLFSLPSLAALLMNFKPQPFHALQFFWVLASFLYLFSSYFLKTRLFLVL